MKPSWKGLLVPEGIQAYGTLTVITQALAWHPSPVTHPQPAFLSHFLGVTSYTITSLDSVPSDSDPVASNSEPLEIGHFQDSSLVFNHKTLQQYYLAPLILHLPRPSSKPSLVSD